MNDNKKFCPALADAGQTGKEDKLAMASNSSSALDCTSKPSSNQSFVIANLLQHGEENAMKAELLRRMLFVSSVRFIFQLIHNERLQGAEILATTKGFFLPSENEEQARQERIAFARRCSHRGIATLSAAQPAKQGLKILPNQATLEEFSNG